MIEYPYFAGKNEYEVPNFKDAPFHLLVTYSDHWYKERCQKKPDSPKLGIVTDLDFFQDGKGRIICHPTVAWEGDVCPCMCHPLNVVPFRKEQELPMMTMDDGQWGTYGPAGKPPLEYYI